MNNLFSPPAYRVHPSDPPAYRSVSPAPPGYYEAAREIVPMHYILNRESEIVPAVTGSIDTFTCSHQFIWHLCNRYATYAASSGDALWACSFGGAVHRFRAQLERDVRRLPCPPVEGISVVQVSTGRVWNLQLDGNPFCGDANDPSENEFNDLRLFIRGLGVNNVERFEITIYDHEEP